MSALLRVQELVFGIMLLYPWSNRTRGPNDLVPGRRKKDRIGGRSFEPLADALVILLPLNIQLPLPVKPWVLASLDS